ncbi:soluble lytic murein transglycosylase-like protein [Thermanaerovibrio velox DSM 12556]|uniref:Soluble lytic murein transglycosylase-like protein n=1 Tax=Thermanaerovibrio velox DSM 12556 TaxID=926567 RepID=H0UPP6_9BACT|nr:lytic transglycosylase domain-containing protein [Thermanaerovibrio velox]EHM09593.1 soluble lytic murein transglycosylase-like protein [Thermanaerovibrio velox DSM 12556]
MRPEGCIEGVLGRIREIESRFGIERRPAGEAVSFEEVLSKAQGDLGDPSLPEGDVDVPSSVAERLERWEPELRRLCDRYGVDPDLARAVMRHESGGREDAVSSAGAIGLMQLMPGTARALGVDPRDPVRNLEGGIKYLAQLLERYGGDVERALAAYNAGAGRVDAHGGVPPIPETQRYVRNVLALYRKYDRGGSM